MTTIEIAVVQLARFLCGAAADVATIRAAWPDCPADGPESRPAVLAWLENHPHILEAVARIDPGADPSEAKPPDGPHLTIGTEAWAGYRLAELLRGDAAYVPAWGWMAWDGKRWVRDAGQLRDLALRRLTQEIAEMIRDAAGDRDRVRELSGVLRAVQRRAFLEAALSFAQPLLLASPEQFDSDPYLLNTPSGVVNLRTGDLLPHRPDFYLTQITAVPYDPQADCPRFSRFLRDVFQGEELARFVQKLLGYGTLGHNAERIFVVMWGRGSNGKSTLCTILAGVLGDYAKEAQPESFSPSRHDVQPRNDLAALRGARIVMMNESREGARLDAALIKQVTGGDLVTARFLYREFFSFRPAFLPILRTNFKPSLPGGDPALWDRIVLVPFLVTIPPDRREAGLADRILAEEGAGVLRWLVEGCRAYLSEGLGAPSEVVEATEEYRRENDPVWAFICECCELAPDARVETSVLYSAFIAWWEENQAGDPPKPQVFGRVLSNFGVGSTKGTGGVRFREGIRLRS